jgi:hypothetical protein
VTREDPLDRDFEGPGETYAVDPGGNPPLLYRRAASEDPDAEDFEPVAGFTNREEAQRFYSWLERLLPRVS